MVYTCTCTNFPPKKCGTHHRPKYIGLLSITRNLEGQSDSITITLGQYPTIAGICIQYKSPCEIREARTGAEINNDHDVLNAVESSFAAQQKLHCAQLTCAYQQNILRSICSCCTDPIIAACSYLLITR